MFWDRMTWHCPFCGSILKKDPNDPPKVDKHEEEYFTCSNLDCSLSLGYIVTLFHPIYGTDRPAGDSWALGLIK